MTCIMQRKKINAANIRSAGYDAASQTLEIEFVNGNVYQYSRVSAEVYRRFANASSPGSFFTDNIEEDYSAKRVK